LEWIGSGRSTGTVEEIRRLPGSARARGNRLQASWGGEMQDTFTLSGEMGDLRTGGVILRLSKRKIESRGPAVSGKRD